MAGLFVKKGDTVLVISGKDRGKEGVVMKAIPDKNKVIVEGVNIAKKHQRPTRATMQGGIIDKDMPIHVSNVALICGSREMIDQTHNRLGKMGFKPDEILTNY